MSFNAKILGFATAAGLIAGLALPASDRDQPTAYYHEYYADQRYEYDDN